MSEDFTLPKVVSAGTILALMAVVFWSGWAWNKLGDHDERLAELKPLPVQIGILTEQIRQFTRTIERIEGKDIWQQKRRADSAD